MGSARLRHDYESTPPASIWAPRVAGLPLALLALATPVAGQGVGPQCAPVHPEVAQHTPSTPFQGRLSIFRDVSEIVAGYCASPVGRWKPARLAVSRWAVAGRFGALRLSRDALSPCRSLGRRCGDGLWVGRGPIGLV